MDSQHHVFFIYPTKNRFCKRLLGLKYLSRNLTSRTSKERILLCISRSANNPLNRRTAKNSEEEVDKEFIQKSFDDIRTYKQER